MSANDVLDWEIVLRTSYLPSNLCFSVKCSFFGQSRLHTLLADIPAAWRDLFTKYADCNSVLEMGVVELISQLKKVRLQSRLPPRNRIVAMVIFITKDSRFQPMTIFSVMNSTYSNFSTLTCTSFVAVFLSFWAKTHLLINSQIFTEYL